jgi:hypothetical protein
MTPNDPKLLGNNKYSKKERTMQRATMQGGRCNVSVPVNPVCMYLVQRMALGQTLDRRADAAMSLPLGGRTIGSSCVPSIYMFRADAVNPIYRAQAEASSDYGRELEGCLFAICRAIEFC